MPNLKPPGGEVSWSNDEGVIGVVGVAPWATLDFLRALYSRVPAQKDWHFPRVIADINCKLPSRGRHLELGERDPSPFIAETISELAGQGATVVVVPCNTAHILYERWAASASVIVPNIVDETVRTIARLGARHVATLASASIYRSGLYAAALDSAGIESTLLSDVEMQLVADAIADVKKNSAISPVLQQRLGRTLDALVARGADGVILGCTELAGLENACIQRDLHVAESNGALATAALREARALTV